MSDELLRLYEAMLEDNEVGFCAELIDRINNWSNVPPYLRDLYMQVLADKADSCVSRYIQRQIPDSLPVEWS